MSLWANMTPFPPLLLHYDSFQWILTDTAGRTAQTSTYKVSKTISKTKMHH